MQTATVKLLKPFAAQQNILNDKTRFKVLAIGRQWGKSELALIDGVKRLLDGQNIWYCSPTNKNTKRMYPKFKAALRGIPKIYTNDTDFIIRMPTGAFIQFVSLHEADNLRGEGLHHMYLDECAFYKAGTWDKVLRPMLAARKGSAWFLSSPNGRNEFWQWFNRGNDDNEQDWQSFYEPSYTSPVLSDSELDDIKRDTPQRVFEQEYMAQFLDDGGAVFRNLKACIVDEPKRSRDGAVIFGVDWARHYDYTVITAIDAETRHVLEVDRFNQIDWTMQRNRLKAMAGRWQPKVIYAEANSIGEPNIEELQKIGLPVQPFNTTAASKAGIINSLALAFEQESVGIPNNPTLLAELQAYSVERTSAGNFRYNAPSGLHDDMVMSLAIAWHGVLHGHATELKVPS